MTPAQVGELTDWQVLNLYSRPAGRDRPPAPPPDRLPTREEFVAGAVAFGGDPDAAGDEYDRMTAEG